MTIGSTNLISGKSGLSALALLAITAQAIVLPQQSTAAPVPSPNTPSQSSGSSSGTGGEPDETNIPYQVFVSPDGQPITTELAIRSPEYCSRLFVERTGKTYAEQYRFWNQCIRGRVMDQ